MEGYRRFWGDSHTNLHARHMEMLDESLAWARELLDFWPMAYYPHGNPSIKGFVVEDWHPQADIDRHWKAICDLAAAGNAPGEFVVFAGYEWQGNGSSGDHNVFYLEDYQPLIRCDRLAELYKAIRRQGLKAYVIPHHTAYVPGVRSKNWDVHDEALSPFAEIFSVHGCSESDEEWIGLRNNRHMGPGVSGGTIEDGLDRGYKIGIIASNDSHGGYGGVWGTGIMACYARQLTRESLWETFGQRRVYGVTGDRIELDFSVESAPMGAVIQKAGPVRTLTKVRCTDALDRIELLRNNRVIANHCHQGTWDVPTGGERSRCKLRVEAGWNTSPGLGGDQPPRDWDCSIELRDGAIVGAEKCWQTPGQRLGQLGGPKCQFGFRTRQSKSEGGGLHTEATVFELEGRPSDRLRLIMEGKGLEITLAEAMAGSAMVHFITENRQQVCETHGIDPRELPRTDRFYYLGPKAKIHRAIPEAGLVGELDYTDPDPPRGTNHYRVRVTQRNGQVAWSSPVWVES